MIKNGILILIAVIYSASLFAQPRTLLSGKVVSTDKSVIDFATVYLKGTQYGCTTNEQGIYHLHAPAGKYTLRVQLLGYETQEKKVTVSNDFTVDIHFLMNTNSCAKTFSYRTGRSGSNIYRSKPCKKISFQCCSSRYKRAS